VEKREGKGKLDMSAWFIEEYHALKGSQSEKSRKLLLNGSAISAVVAGRSVDLFSALSHQGLHYLTSIIRLAILLALL
jgi:hypothetical protein